MFRVNSDGDQCVDLQFSEPRHNSDLRICTRIDQSFMVSIVVGARKELPIK